MGGQDDFDDDAALAKYRAQRLKEMKVAAARERFGEVVEITCVGWLFVVGCFGEPARPTSRLTIRPFFSFLHRIAARPTGCAR